MHKPSTAEEEILELDFKNEQLSATAHFKLCPNNDRIKEGSSKIKFIAPAPH